MSQTKTDTLISRGEKSTMTAVSLTEEISGVDTWQTDKELYRELETRGRPVTAIGDRRGSSCS